MTGKSARLTCLALRLIVCASFGLPAALVASCAGLTFVVQQYDGPPRPKESVAVIRVTGGTGPELVSVDDEPMRVALEKGNRIHVEVLPGTHEVEVASPGTGPSRAIAVRFVAEPGKVYRFELRALETATTFLPEPEWEALAYEVDRNSDAQLKLAARPPEPVLPPQPAHEIAAPPPPERRAVEAGADAPGEES